MGGHKELGLELAHVVEGLDPGANGARGGPANGVQIGESVVVIIARHEELLAGQPDEELVVRLPVRLHELEGQPAGLRPC